MIETFTDSRDGKKYEYVKIGSQMWMAENLDYEAEGSKRCEDYPPGAYSIYGRLYDWNTAIKACPSGWHLPSNEEWQTLVDFVGGVEVAGKKLKSRNGWNFDEAKEKGFNGTDEYGFSAQPGGCGDSTGNILYIGFSGYWWSSEYDSDSAYCLNMDYDSEDTPLYIYCKSDFLSVRCLKN